MHKDLPPFNIACRMICESEIVRINSLKRALKKARKEYIRIQSDLIQASTDEEAELITQDYPVFKEMYADLDKKLNSIDDEKEKNNELSD